jgi:hypothetical protein
VTQIVEALAAQPGACQVALECRGDTASVERLAEGGREHQIAILP